MARFACLLLAPTIAVELRQTVRRTGVYPQIKKQRGTDDRALKRLMIAGLLAGISGMTQAEDVDIGKAGFLASCASCHGADCRGGGSSQRTPQIVAAGFDDPGQEQRRQLPRKRRLRSHPRIENNIRSRHTRDADWGERFNPIVGLPHAVDPYYWSKAGPESSAEVVVRKRLLVVVDHLKRIQQKWYPIGSAAAGERSILAPACLAVPTSRRAD